MTTLNVMYVFKKKSGMPEYLRICHENRLYEYGIFGYGYSPKISHVLTIYVKKTDLDHLLEWAERLNYRGI